MLSALLVTIVIAEPNLCIIRCQWILYIILEFNSFGCWPFGPKKGLKFYVRCKLVPIKLKELMRTAMLGVFGFGALHWFELRSLLPLGALGLLHFSPWTSTSMQARFYLMLFVTLHNVLFGQYDSPVSKNWNPKTTFPWKKLIFEVIFPMFF